MLSIRRHWERAVGLAVVFLGGIAVGVAAPRGGTSRVDSAPAIVRVAGEDALRGSAASAPVEGGAKDASPPESAAKQRRVLPPAADVPARPTSRKVARQALSFTAFIRNGGTYGAGVLLDERGHVLTCHHVIEGAGKISVSFSDAGSFTAEVVDVDRQLDLALLKIPTTRASKARLASVASVQMGDDVFAMGAPRKLRFSLSRGLVSFVGRPFGSLYYLQTDLPTNGGNSGGPVMNDRGDVVGITSFIYRDTQGLSFALPIDYAFARFARHLQSAALDRTAFAEWEQSAKKRGSID